MTTSLTTTNWYYALRMYVDKKIGDYSNLHLCNLCVLIIQPGAMW
jgi:hypothetical protein